MIKKIFKSAEYLFVIFSLILFTNGVLDLIAIDGFSEGDGDYSRLVSANEKIFVLKQSIFYVIYIISFLLLPRATNRSTKISVILSQNISIFLLTGLAVLSTVWSDLPAATLSRSIALVGTTIFGIYFANRYTLKEQLVLLGHAFFIIVVLSFVFAIAIPQYGVMGIVVHVGGAWRGIYTHKNELGRLIALGGIIFLMQPKRESKISKHNLKTRSIGKLSQSFPTERKRNLFLRYLFVSVGFCLSILLILLSQSSGGLINLVIITLAFFVFKINQLKSTQRFIAILGTVVLLAIYAVIVIPDPESVFASFGKSSDLSGRWDIWRILLVMLANRFLLGFGYGAFWDSQGSTVALELAWESPHAHNGFLDLAMSVGCVGLGIFIFSYSYLLVKCFAKFRDNRSDENIYPLIMLIYIAIANISETGLFTHNYIFWLLYVIVGYSTVVVDNKLPTTKEEPLPVNLKPQHVKAATASFRGKSRSLDALAFRSSVRSLETYAPYPNTKPANPEDAPMTDDIAPDPWESKSKTATDVAPYPWNSKSNTSSGVKLVSRSHQKSVNAPTLRQEQTSTTSPSPIVDRHPNLLLKNQKYMRTNIAGTEIDCYSFDEVLELTIDRALTGTVPAYIVTPNAQHINNLQDDSLFKKIYSKAFLVIPDGVSIIWAAKFLKTPLRGKISGVSLFEKICEQGAVRPLKIFLLGGRPQAAERAAAILEQRYPGLQIAGTHCPPYGFESNQDELDLIDRKILAAQPNILFVGLGSPKQEKWIYERYRQLKVPVSIGVGVSFEFVAGMVKRAPVWMQENGLEWFFRLLTEPKRLWRRYILGNPRFIFLVLQQKMKTKSTKKRLGKSIGS